ncbi:pathogen-associated molecular patterns-induced protein A70 [Mercurialis annua]|uniref:pathogen-associated molecular patterns-induced protein A70 n=1 Tax=Mercurialis annua TaxID=3986 RepID=UPI0021607458|nr:pathogen-associated molecular patterns-induced protein A70 [Mercurialis annua]
MLEESLTSIPSIWASLNSWFTPTVLFLFLNLMIGTIFVTSSLATPKPTSNNTQHNHQLARSPSVLQRLKSINFHSLRSAEKTQHFDNNVIITTNYHQSPLEEYHQNQSFLSRSPSMLQRIKSVNLYNYFSQELPKNQEPHTPTNQDSLQEHQETDTFQEHQETDTFQEQYQEPEEDTIQDQEQTLDEIYSKLKTNFHQVGRSKSDTKPTAGEVSKKLAKKMRKSASTKSAFAHFEEEDDDIVESRRPATVREGKSGGHRMTEVDDAEVDAKADDFINRFKQQLKLQRVDSIVRYKEMVNRGSNNAN